MTTYPARFFIDEHFIKDVLKDKKRAIEVIKKLSRVHTTSNLYPFCHNILFDESFKNAIKDKLVRGHALLGAMHPIKCPDFLESEKDIESKVIRYCISLASRKPYKVIILTSEEKAKKYMKNKHYNKDKVISEAILIACEDLAFEFINLVSSY